MAIKDITVASWEEFLAQINNVNMEIKNLKQENKYLHVSDILYRGHSKSGWPLKTTLERYSSHEFTWDEYHQIIESTLSATDAFTRHKFQIPQEVYGDTPSGYEYMVYLRHHGFPSPLLDWTRSPYVAAFFAFATAKKDEDPAILTFREYKDGGKSCLVGEPEIQTLGPYIRNAHKRHHIQQCEYTICYKKNLNDEHKVIGKTYVPHEDACFSDEQDILQKYIIPYSEREKVMAELDKMNINAFTLFGNEEGLASMLAYREIEQMYGTL